MANFVSTVVRATLTIHSGSGAALRRLRAHDPLLQPVPVEAHGIEEEEEPVTDRLLRFVDKTPLRNIFRLNRPDQTH